MFLINRLWSSLSTSPWQINYHLYHFAKVTILPLKLTSFLYVSPDNPCVSLCIHPVDGAGALSRLEVPEFEVAVQGAADDLTGIKLETCDWVLVPCQRTHALPFHKTPYL